MTLTSTEVEWDEIRFAHEVDKYWAEYLYLCRENGVEPAVDFDGFADQHRRTWEQEHPVVAAPVVDPDDDPIAPMRLWTTRELLEADQVFSWRVRGMLAQPTYGEIAGEKKSLKSYIGTMLDVAVASGERLFGQFGVDQPAPVIVYVGEGGRIPYTRRLTRIADAMGVDLEGLPLYTSFEVHPIGGAAFRASVATHLEVFQPGLLHIDPLYTFHPTDRDARNLMESGAMLAGISGPCMEAGCCLLLTNHFNKTGSGRGLDRITQSGSAEWCDTWLLLSHRETPDVQNGKFRLLLEIGSRQWGGSEWDLDLDIGRFDPDLGEFDGEITWELRRHDPSVESDETRVVTIARLEPFEYTREQLAKRAGGNVQRMRQVIDNADRKRLITVKLVTRNRSNGRPDKAWVYGPAEPASDQRTDVDAGWVAE